MIMLSCCSENFIAMSLSPWSGAFTAGRQAVDLPLILKRQADSWPLSGGSTAAQRLVPLQAVGLPLPSGLCRCPAVGLPLPPLAASLSAPPGKYPNLWDLCKLIKTYKNLSYLCKYLCNSR